MSQPRVSDTWERGSPYEQYIGRWSRRMAPVFLSWLAAPANGRWLDVGCGTGALSAAIVDHCSPARVVGVEPSEGFLKLAAASLGGRAELVRGSADALPVAGATIDHVVSGLVLNFVPNLPAALAEMARVAVPDGTIAAYVWDYADRMELIRHFWDAAVLLDPSARALHEGVRFPLCRPQALQAAFDGAGLVGTQIEALEVATDFADFDDYWSPFLGGQGPAPAYLMSLADDRRAQLREVLRARLPTSESGGIALVARAWAVRARRPGHRADA
ncbi:MAG TPA: methyltransferase domain-containing protein [Burkholderiaceae bacterium]|nr:methyltransferase domain-containing protein [Burkholderiaceae bacterium]